MKWYSESYGTKRKRIEQWKPWFAWHPIWIDDHAYWLTKVQRKKVYLEFFIGEYWDYKEL